MREVKITAGGRPQYVRALVGGLPGNGKTSFGATAPKPLFISDAAEGGYKTLYQMDPTLWWDAKVPPEVWTIESMKDVPQILTRLEDLAIKGKFPYQTLVFDPLSIYTDRIIAELQQQNPGRDNRQVYGDLANHLRVLVLRLHALPAHVIWLTHVKSGGSDVNGPAIGGSMGEKFAAYCDFKWLTWAQSMQGQASTFELRTAPFRTWNWLGGRWQLPDPMIPSFKCVAQILGLVEQPVSPAVPGYPQGVNYNGWQNPPAA
jgi:hypothetical protein